MYLMHQKWKFHYPFISANHILPNRNSYSKFTSVRSETTYCMMHTVKPLFFAGSIFRGFCDFLKIRENQSREKLFRKKLFPEFQNTLFRSYKNHIIYPPDHACVQILVLVVSKNNKPKNSREKNTLGRRTGYVQYGCGPMIDNLL